MKPHQKVWFYRDGMGEPAYYEATIVAIYPLKSVGSIGLHHFIIQCPTPFVIGFAHDDELFISESAVKAKVLTAKRAYIQKEISKLEFKVSQATAELVSAINRYNALEPT